MRGTKNNQFFVSGTLFEAPVVKQFATKSGEVKDIIHFVVQSERENFDEDLEPCKVAFSTFGKSKIDRLQNTGIGAPITVKGYIEASYNTNKDEWFSNIRVSSISAPVAQGQTAGQQQQQAPVTRPSDALDYSNAAPAATVRDDIPF